MTQLVTRAKCFFAIMGRWSCWVLRRATRRLDPSVLDSPVLGAPLLDHHGLDLTAARRVRYVLEQSFRYEYDAPVSALRQRLVIVPPPRHGCQYRRAHRLEVTGARASRRVQRDVDGNVVALLRAERVAQVIEFRLAAVIERVHDDGPLLLPAAALHSARLLRPTRLTTADERLRDLAADIAAAVPRRKPRRKPPPWSTTRWRTCSATATAFTGVSTTAAEAAAIGHGVCQDYAHIMLAVCHELGLPARYVSGHLLGQGGTHAWVEVIVPRGRRPRRSRSTRATAAGPARATSPSPPAATTPTSRPPRAPTRARARAG